MGISFGSALAVLHALALVAIGLGAMAAPRFSSGQYGMPTEHPVALALVRALGVRDLVLGIVIGALLALGATRALGITLLVTALVAGVDLTLVRRGPLRSRVVHAAGGVALVLAGILVLLGV
jgi:hypothetical protein